MKNKYLIHSDVLDYDYSILPRDLPKIIAKLFYRFPEIMKIRSPSGQWFNFDVSDVNLNTCNPMIYEQFWLGFISSFFTTKERDEYKKYLRGDKK